MDSRWKLRAVKKARSLEDVVADFCEVIDRLSEREKADLSQQLIEGFELPPHFRWIN